MPNPSLDEEEEEVLNAVSEDTSVVESVKVKFTFRIAHCKHVPALLQREQ